MVHFDEFLKTSSLWSNSVTRQVNFNRTKIGGKCQNSKVRLEKKDKYENCFAVCLLCKARLHYANRPFRFQFSLEVSKDEFRKIGILNLHFL